MNIQRNIICNKKKRSTFDYINNENFIMGKCIYLDYKKKENSLLLLCKIIFTKTKYIMLKNVW